MVLDCRSHPPSGRRCCASPHQLHGADALTRFADANSSSDLPSDWMHSNRQVREAPPPAHAAYSVLHALPLMAVLQRIARRLLPPLVAPFIDRRPAARLIRHSAKRYWKLIALNFTTSLTASLSEGATLGIIFLAVSLISRPQNSDWNHISFLAPLRHLPSLQSWLNGLLNSFYGREAIFVLLLAAAVALQAVMAATTYVSNVSTAVLGARLSEKITSNLNARVLSLTFACASRYRVGDLLNYVGSGGSTVQKEISLTSSLLTNGLQVADLSGHPGRHLALAASCGHRHGGCDAERPEVAAAAHSPKREKAAAAERRTLQPSDRADPGSQAAAQLWSTEGNSGTTQGSTRGDQEKRDSAEQAHQPGAADFEHAADHRDLPDRRPEPGVVPGSQHGGSPEPGDLHHHPATAEPESRHPDGGRHKLRHQFRPG